MYIPPATKPKRWKKIDIFSDLFTIKFNRASLFSYSKITVTEAVKPFQIEKDLIEETIREAVPNYFYFTETFRSIVVSGCED